MTKSIFDRGYGARDLNGNASYLALWYLGILDEEEHDRYVPEKSGGGDDGDGDLAEPTVPWDIVQSVTMLPYDHQMAEWRERNSWQHSAWHDGRLGKIAVRLASHCIYDESCADTPEAWSEAEANVREHVGDLDRWIVRRATEDEIADALAQVADALGQEITREAAQCIVPMIERTTMPLMAVHEMCRKVAETETGKLKPASFAKMIAEVRRRRSEFEHVRDAVRELVVHFDIALAYIANAIAKDKAERVPEMATANGAAD